MIRTTRAMPMFALSLLAGCADKQAERIVPVTLCITCDTAGWLTPCGCTSNQAGGLARRGGYVGQLRNEIQRGEAERKGGQVIVADVGGAPSGNSEYDRLKFLAILRGEVAMQVAAHNLGPAELALGAEALRQLARESGAPLLSANVRDATGQPLAEGVRMLPGPAGVALIGVVDPQLVADKDRAGLQISDPKAAIATALAGLQGKYRLAVILAYAAPDTLRDLARTFPEVDAVVGGPTSQSLPAEYVGPVLVTAVAQKGKFLASLSTVPPDEKSGKASATAGSEVARSAASRARLRGEIVELDSRWPDAAEQIANLARFHKELQERDFTPEATSFASTLLPAEDAGWQLVGNERCIACHEDDCRAWNKSPHAKAWQVLVKSQSEYDSYCQRCHSTGYGSAGGFRSVSLSRERFNVGCESCHGPGARHAERPEVHTAYVAADQCAGCHDRENSPEFAYEAYWPRIAHGAPAHAPHEKLSARAIQEIGR